VSGPSAVLALAAAAVALSLQISSGMYDERALVLVTLATAAAIIAVVWRRRGTAVPEVPLAAQAVLGGGCAAGLLCHLFLNPTFYGDARAFQGGFRWFALISLVILSAYLCIHLRASLIRARFLLLLACFAIMGVVVIRASPRPWVDVWTFQQGAADALLHGVNPYRATYPNIYGGQAAVFYAPELIQGGRVAAFPYTPLTILADLPGFALFGDVRYSLLALLIASAWLIARAAPGVTGELAALLTILQPRSFFVLEQAWSEPLVLFCFALTVFLLARGRYAAVCGFALGLLAASKQYSPFLLAPLAVLMPGKRGLLVAAAVLIAVLAPFAIGDPSAFWRGLAVFQTVQPFRADSLSLTAAAVRLFGNAVLRVSVAGIAFGIAALALGIRRSGGLPLACAAAAAAWAAVLVWNKQAFCNYWWLASGLLGVAAAAPVVREKA
jgi:hypothetical protein